MQTKAPILNISRSSTKVELTSELDTTPLKTKIVTNQQERKYSKYRKITTIVTNVFKWRKYAKGIYEDGKFIKLTLAKAAAYMGMSKKSLDDYLLQIRLGAKFGFDFIKNKE